MESLTNRKKVVSDKPMTFMEKLYLPAIFKGMFITLKHMFKKNNTIKYPVSDLTEVTLSDKYQIKPPTFLGQAHIEDDVNLISDDDIFTEVGEGDYIFYKLTTEDSDELKVLGKVFQKTDPTTVVLEFDAPIADDETVDVYKFSRNSKIANFDFSS